MRQATTDHDYWLAVGPYGNEDEAVGEFEFNTRLRGGTVKVTFESTREQEYDEDGPCGSYLDIDIKLVTWSFNSEHEVDLTDDEEEELKEACIECAENN